MLENLDENYAATIIRVKSLVKLEGLDNLRGIPLFGVQCLVGQDVNEGDLGVLFIAGTQLSEQFCKENNLFRHKEFNKDPEKVGYFEDSRRVKALKLRKHYSTAFFIPLSSLGYLGEYDYKEGDSFTHVNGIEVCRKYHVKESKGPGVSKPRKIKQYLVDPKLFPEHFKTHSYFRDNGSIPNSNWITVTQKLHGTSARYCNQKTQRKLSFMERWLKWFG